jgi:electron transfer flavoprotein alpha/beta subunit
MQPLKIAVCIEPVPDPKQWNKLSLDPHTMLLARSAIPAVINPLDRVAIEQAVRLKTERGGVVSVLTMAPPDAEDQLIEALAMGCDRAYLLTDVAFAGADTLATARCLSAAIRKIGEQDLVFCGGYSLDGSTAQVGPQVAELLGLPDLTHVLELQVAGSAVEVRCKAEEGPACYGTDLPALITFSTEATRPRLPSMVGLRKAIGTPITTWTAADLNLKPEEIGLRGSPTQMLNVFSASTGRKGEILQGTPDELATTLLGKLHLKPAPPAGAAS